MKTILNVLLVAMSVSSLMAGSFANEYSVVGKVVQKIDAGLLVNGKITDSSLKNINSDYRTDIVLIVDYPNASQIYDGQVVNCRTYDAGTYQYTDVMGGQRTVQKLTFSSFPQGFDPDRH